MTLPSGYIHAYYCCRQTSVLVLGMSFGVRFKVRTFGNKHPDGSNVAFFRIRSILYVHLHDFFLLYVLERTFIIKSH